MPTRRLRLDQYPRWAIAVSSGMVFLGGGSKVGVDLGVDGDVGGVADGVGMEGRIVVVVVDGTVDDCSIYCSWSGDGIKGQVKESPSSKWRVVFVFWISARCVVLRVNACRLNSRWLRPGTK